MSSMGPRARSATREIPKESEAAVAAAVGVPARPRLMLFAPSNDPGFGDSIKPLLEGHFEVDSFELASDCILAAKDRQYAALVAKLGTEDNLGVDVIAACRGEFGSSIAVAIHSATVAKRPSWRESFTRDMGVEIFAQHGGEAQLVAKLTQAVAITKRRKNLLLFAPPNDPNFAQAIKPVLEEHDFNVDIFTRAQDCIQAVQRRAYVACVAKLGTDDDNLGEDVIAACRAKFGSSIQVALHSSTAARNPEMRASLAESPGVDIFAEHGGEAALAAELAQAVA